MTKDKHTGCPFGYGSEEKVNVRKIEKDMKQDFSKDMSYGDYLNLNKLLSLQTPLSDHHDEMLFIIIHHASELWIKLAEHELAAAMKDIENDNVEQALKKLSRISRIQENLIQSWSILSTLTPADYLEFRDDLGNSSGFQSYGYRSLEFMLGNKNEKMLNVHKHDKEVYAKLKTILDAPSVYELVLQKLSQHFPIDDEVINRDFSKPYVANESVLNAWMKVYQESEKYWQFYAIAEKLVDIEDTFQNWRFRHLSTVKRIIGFKTGTGGSSGVGFLEKALEINFFPELFDVRTEL